MLLRKLRIGTRLALGFGAFLAIMMVVTIGGAALGKSNRAELFGMIAAAGAKEGLAAEMRSLALEQSAVMRNIGLHSDIKAMQGDEDRARSLGKAYDEARTKMAALATLPDELAILDTLNKLDKELDKPFAQALGLSTSFRNEEAAQVLMKEIDPTIQKSLSELGRLVALQKAANREAMQSATTRGEQLVYLIYSVDAVVIALAAMLAWTTIRSITGPLREAVQFTRRVAAGDLTSKIEVSGNDEATELLTALRDMNDGLGQIVTQIRGGADAIAVGAGEVAAGNQQLSSRTEEHASSLEETASTLEEFTATVRQNADHAKQASQLAGTASSTAQKGGEVVSRVVTTMQEVSTSSKKISDIIGVIDGISFQTNILALNAAVEAARAGEQGRGFAVVASEVRSLSQRSAESAKEIRGLIENSVNRIEAGAKLVDQAGRTMDELVDSVRKVAEIMTEIAAASHEQSSGVEQINKAITQMDTVVQMNAALVEQATAAATSMAQQATGLAHAVAQFRVLEDTVDARPIAMAAAGQPPRIARAAERQAVGVRKAPALTADDAGDWKEF